MQPRTFLSLAAWILLMVGPAAASELQNGVPVTGLSGAQGEQLQYWIDVPDGAEDLRVTTTCGTGAAGLYFRHGAPPTPSTYHPASPGRMCGGGSLLPSPLPGRWYFLVFGHSAFSGFGFEVSYVCGAGCVPVSRCVAARTLTCNDGHVYANDDPGSTDNVETYACTPTLNHSGPEMTYNFRAGVDGEVTARLKGLTDDLDLLVLQDRGNGCEPEGCFARSTSSGTSDENVTFQAVAGTTYFIVVDGYWGAVSDYSIELICPNNGLIFTDGFETGDLSSWRTP